MTAPASTTNLHDGFVAFAQLVGPEHLVDYANPGWSALFPDRESVGVPFVAIAAERVDTEAIDRLDKVFAEGVPFYGNQQSLLIPGVGEVLLDVRLEPRFDAVGNVVGVNVFAVDVTRQARASRMLHEQRDLLEQVASTGALADVLTRMLQLIEEQSGDGVLGSVLLLDDSGHLRHGAAPSLPDFYNEAIDGLAIGPNVGSCGTAAYLREQVIVTDVTTDPLWAEFRDLAAQAGVQACWSTPILSSGGRVIGTFAMYYRTPRAPTVDDLGAAEMFARTASLAIERHLADQARAEVQADLQFLLQVSTEMAGASGYVASAERLARLVVPRICAACAVDVSTDNGLQRIAVAVADDPVAEEQLIRFTPSASRSHPAAQLLAGATAARTIRGDRIQDFATDDAHRAVLDAAGVSEFATVPLTARGVTFGALTLMATEALPLTDASISLAEDLARRVAQVLDTVRQFEQRVRLVRDLQAELLPPSLPRIPGVELAASYHPGADGLDVGGDFYDVIPLDDGRWVLVVGDVSGRGARAASTTALVRFTARAVAPLSPDAAGVLQATNSALLSIEDDERFITAACAELKPQTDGSVSVAIAVAGHPAPLVRRANGTVEAIEASGPLLGQLPEIDCPVQQLTLHAGDSLVMVTDGVLECRAADREMFGEQRLVDVVAASPGSADPLVAAVDQAVNDFAGGSLSDDRAVIAVTARLRDSC